MVAPALSAQFAPSNDPALSTFSRGQIVEGIRSFNATASTEYLASFDDRSLRLYLEHLRAASAPRGRTSVWERPGDTPAVLSHDPLD